MITKSIQQEILLFTTTSFAKRQQNMEECERKKLTPMQLLEAKCWNGFIQNTMSEIYEMSNKEFLILQEIDFGNGFIILKFSDFSKEIEEQECSINPYTFLEVQTLN